jgi:hypothetical protein
VVIRRPINNEVRIMSNAPHREDVLYDITRYLLESAQYGGDIAYLVQQTMLGMGLVITATDIDSMEYSEWELTLLPRPAKFSEASR